MECVVYYSQHRALLKKAKNGETNNFRKTSKASNESPARGIETRSYLKGNENRIAVGCCTSPNL